MSCKHLKDDGMTKERMTEMIKNNCKVKKERKKRHLYYAFGDVLFIGKLSC